MPERIHMTHLNAPEEHFSIHAITLSSEKVPPIEGGGVEVELRINGIEVPFTQTIRNIYAQMEDTINQRVAEKIEEQVSLNDLINDIRSAEFEIRNKIYSILGIELRD